MTHDPDIMHRRMYETIRSEHPEIPAWEDLTDEQKATMREANDWYTRYMNDLGDSIRKGAPT